MWKTVVTSNLETPTQISTAATMLFQEFCLRSAAPLWPCQWSSRALNLLCAVCVRSCMGMSEIAMLMSETCFQVDRQIYKM